MNDDILMIAVLGGSALMFVGWIWSMVVARRVHVGWFAGMAIMFIITLPLFALIHWEKSKKPFLVSLVGIALIWGAMYSLPENSAN